MSISALRRRKRKKRCPKCKKDQLMWKHSEDGLYAKVCPSCGYCAETRQLKPGDPWPED
jgi:Zn ribbon nucleic-acid-binding protein